MEVHPHNPRNALDMLRRRLLCAPVLADAVPEALVAVLPLPAVEVGRGRDGGDGPAADALDELGEEDVGEAVEGGEQAVRDAGDGEGAGLFGSYLGFGLEEDGFGDGGVEGIEKNGRAAGGVCEVDDLVALRE